MSAKASKGGARDGQGRPSPPARESLMRVGDDFEDEYPGASGLATECYANVIRTGDLLIDLHNRQTREDYQLSPGARQVLAVVEGAGQPLEPTEIAQRVLVTAASMTSVLDTLEKRGLIRRLRHPNDRRKLLVDVTEEARAILNELLPSLHARERELISGALSTSEQHELLRLIAKVQQAAIRASSTPSPRGAVRRRRGDTPSD